VLRVQPDSAAEKAGMRATRRDDSGTLIWGDIIIALDAQKIEDSTDLFRVLDHYEVGQTVKVEVLRNAQTAEARKTELSVTLQPLP
jgi:S1-C subfamily serine protease